MASVSTFSRWVKPEVYPLFAMVGAAIGFLTFTGVRTVMVAPDVLIRKDLRQDGGAPCSSTQGYDYRHGYVREMTRKFYNFESTTSALEPSIKS